MKTKMGALLRLALAVFLLSACAAPSTQTNVTNWQEQYDLGIRYLAERNYSEAIIAFTAAIEIDAKQALAYKSLSEAYLGIGNYEEAINTLSRGFTATNDKELGDLLNTLQTELSHSAVPEPENDGTSSSGSLASLENISITNIKYNFIAGEDEYNPGSIGVMEVSGNYNASPVVQDLLLASWQDSWSDSEIADAISFYPPIWKDQVSEMSAPNNFFMTMFPVYEDDSGKDYELLFIGLNADIDAVGYATSHVHIP